MVPNQKEVGFVGSIKRIISGRPVPPRPMARDCFSPQMSQPMTGPHDPRIMRGYSDWGGMERAGSMTTLNMQPGFGPLMQAHSMAQLNCPSCHHHGFMWGGDWIRGGPLVGDGGGLGGMWGGGGGWGGSSGMIGRNRYTDRDRRGIRRGGEGWSSDEEEIERRSEEEGERSDFEEDDEEIDKEKRGRWKRREEKGGGGSWETGSNRGLGGGRRRQLVVGEGSREETFSLREGVGRRRHSEAILPPRRPRDEDEEDRMSLRGGGSRRREIASETMSLRGGMRMRSKEREETMSLSGGTRRRRSNREDGEETMPNREGGQRRVPFEIDRDNEMASLREGFRRRKRGEEEEGEARESAFRRLGGGRGKEDIFSTGRKLEESGISYERGGVERRNLIMREGLEVEGTPFLDDKTRKEDFESPQHVRKKKEFLSTNSLRATSKRNQRFSDTGKRRRSPIKLVRKEISSEEDSGDETMSHSPLVGSSGAEEVQSVMRKRSEEKTSAKVEVVRVANGGVEGEVEKEADVIIVKTPPPLGPIPTTDWECVHCTFVNKAGGRICVVCCKTSSIPNPAVLTKALSALELNDGNRKSPVSEEKLSIHTLKVDSDERKRTQVISKGTSPPPQSASTQTYDVVGRLRRSSSMVEEDSWSAPQRSISRQSLLSDTQSLPLTPNRRRNSPDNEGSGGTSIATTLTNMRQVDLISSDYMSSIKQVKQGLEMVKILREAEDWGFTAEELGVGLSHCGEGGDPIAWLKENWSQLVETVLTLATNYGHERKENTIGTLSKREAAAALVASDANIWTAVTHCVEQRQAKYAELVSRGNFTREEVVTALTAAQGDVEVAWSELSRDQLKPFLMRIWGPPQGEDNQDHPLTHSQPGDGMNLIKEQLNEEVSFERRFNGKGLTGIGRREKMLSRRARRHSDIHRFLERRSVANEGLLRPTTSMVDLVGDEGRGGQVDDVGSKEEIYGVEVSEKACNELKAEESEWEKKTEKRESSVEEKEECDKEEFEKEDDGDCEASVYESFPSETETFSTKIGGKFPSRIPIRIKRSPSLPSIGYQTKGLSSSSSNEFSPTVLIKPEQRPYTRRSLSEISYNKEDSCSENEYIDESTNQIQNNSTKTTKKDGTLESKEINKNRMNHLPEKVQASSNSLNQNEQKRKNVKFIHKKPKQKRYVLKKKPNVKMKPVTSEDSEPSLGKLPMRNYTMSIIKSELLSESEDKKTLENYEYVLSGLTKRQLKNDSKLEKLHSPSAKQNSFKISKNSMEKVDDIDELEYFDVDDDIAVNDLTEEVRLHSTKFTSNYDEKESNKIDIFDKKRTEDDLQRKSSREDKTEKIREVKTITVMVTKCEGIEDMVFECQNNVHNMKIKGENLEDEIAAETEYEEEYDGITGTSVEPTALYLRPQGVRSKETWKLSEGSSAGEVSPIPTDSEREEKEEVVEHKEEESLNDIRDENDWGEEEFYETHEGLSSKSQDLEYDENISQILTIGQEVLPGDASSFSLEKYSNQFNTESSHYINDETIENYSIETISPTEDCFNKVGTEINEAMIEKSVLEIEPPHFLSGIKITTSTNLVDNINNIQEEVSVSIGTLDKKKETNKSSQTGIELIESRFPNESNHLVISSKNESNLSLVNSDLDLENVANDSILSLQSKELPVEHMENISAKIFHKNNEGKAMVQSNSNSTEESNEHFEIFNDDKQFIISNNNKKNQIEQNIEEKGDENAVVIKSQNDKENEDLVSIEKNFIIEDKNMKLIHDSSIQNKAAINFEEQYSNAVEKNLTNKIFESSATEEKQLLINVTHKPNELLENMEGGLHSNELKNKPSHDCDSNSRKTIENIGNNFKNNKTDQEFEIDGKEGNETFHNDERIGGLMVLADKEDNLSNRISHNKREKESKLPPMNVEENKKAIHVVHEIKSQEKDNVKVGTIKIEKVDYRKLKKKPKGADKVELSNVKSKARKFKEKSFTTLKQNEEGNKEEEKNLIGEEKDFQKANNLKKFETNIKNVEEDKFLSESSATSEKEDLGADGVSDEEKGLPIHGEFHNVHGEEILVVIKNNLSKGDNLDNIISSLLSFQETSSPKNDPTAVSKLEREARRFLAEGLVNDYREAEVAARLMAMDFNQDESAAAATHSTSLPAALAFLRQDCPLCAGVYSANEMVSMLECDHRCCKECAIGYFGVQLREKNVDDCVCPICGAPDVRSMGQDPALLYFSNLDILLKTVLPSNLHELFQRKLRDRTLMQDPDFKWCGKCSSGFIANPRQKRLICPDCKTISCAKCGREWSKGHEGVSCEQLVTEETDAEGQLQKHLIEHGVACPKCSAKYCLAKGGCMHLTCPGCKHEFCQGCSKPFLMGDNCQVSLYCSKLGLHAHHPRNCLFYLRDKEPELLEKLLQDNGIDYTRKEEGDNGSGRCKVELLREKDDELIESICGLPVHSGGLCRSHYIEWLVVLVRRTKVDPCHAMDAMEVSLELKRRGKEPPPRDPNVSDSQYLTACIKMVQEEIPLE